MFKCKTRPRKSAAPPHIADRTAVCRRVTEAAKQGALPTIEQLYELRLGLLQARRASSDMPTSLLGELATQSRLTLVATARMVDADPDSLMQEVARGLLALTMRVLQAAENAHESKPGTPFGGLAIAPGARIERENARTNEQLRREG